MLFLLNSLLYVHFAAFLTYLTTLLRQWDHPVKRTTNWMLYCGITLLLTGIGLVAVRYPVVNYVKVVPKSALLVVIAAITAAHRGKILSRQTWQLLIGLTALTVFIALWRMA
ncbi:hypothetical protein ACFSUS_19200 [Spirosoma soli]|uniref:Uncharacterized protein n=1 Tax=Spirosoma soli TaxID=1770529 RepID=A0ABW5M8G1_9BACT